MFDQPLGVFLFPSNQFLKIAIPLHFDASRILYNMIALQRHLGANFPRKNWMGVRPPCPPASYTTVMHALWVKKCHFGRFSEIG